MDVLLIEDEQKESVWRVAYPIRWGFAQNP